MNNINLIKNKEDWENFLKVVPKTDYLSVIKHSPDFKNPEEYEEIANIFEEIYKSSPLESKYGRHNSGPLENIDFSLLNRLNKKEKLNKILYKKYGVIYMYGLYKHLLRITDDFLSGFQSLGYDIILVKKGTELNRCGNDIYEYGSFYSTIKVKTEIEARDIFALRNYWVNINLPKRQKENLRLLLIEKKHNANIKYDRRKLKEIKVKKVKYPSFNEVSKRYDFVLKEDTYFIVGKIGYQGDQYYGSKEGNEVLQYYIPWQVSMSVLEFKGSESLK